MILKTFLFLNLASFMFIIGWVKFDHFVNHPEWTDPILLRERWELLLVAIGNAGVALFLCSLIPAKKESDRE